MSLIKAKNRRRNKIKLANKNLFVSSFQDYCWSRDSKTISTNFNKQYIYVYIDSRRSASNSIVTTVLKFLLVLLKHEGNNNKVSNKRNMKTENWPKCKSLLYLIFWLIHMDETVILLGPHFPASILQAKQYYSVKHTQLGVGCSVCVFKCFPIFSCWNSRYQTSKKIKI